MAWVGSNTSFLRAKIKAKTRKEMGELHFFQNWVEVKSNMHNGMKQEKPLRGLVTNSGLMTLEDMEREF